MLLQRETPLDVVIATGRTVSLEYFVNSAFTNFGLDWRKHVRQDASLLRPADVSYSAANITRATLELGWTAKHSIDDVVREMCRAERERHEQGQELL